MKMIVLFACLMMLPVRAYAGEVRVAVAANFAVPFAAIAKAYTQATGNHVVVSIGSTGKLFAQIENGAPFELFLAADMRRPRRLVADGLAVAGSARIYAMGRLVLWSPHLDVSHGPGALKGASVRHIAIANPKTAPYGAAAIQALGGLGLAGPLTPKLVMAENIAQAYEYVASGNADAGFVAASQLKGPKAPGGYVWPVPTKRYHPIAQGLCLLKSGAHDPAARSLVAFLASSPARVIIAGFGYGVPRP